MCRSHRLRDEREDSDCNERKKAQCSGDRRGGRGDSRRIRGRLRLGMRKRRRSRRGEERRGRTDSCEVKGRSKSRRRGHRRYIAVLGGKSEEDREAQHTSQDGADEAHSRQCTVKKESQCSQGTQHGRGDRRQWIPSRSSEGRMRSCKSE